MTNNNYRYSVEGLTTPDAEGRSIVTLGYFTNLRQAISTAKRAFEEYAGLQEMHVWQMTGSWDTGYTVHSEWDSLFSRYASRP